VSRRPPTRRLYVAARNALLDLRYGRVLAGSVQSRYAHLGAFHVTNSEYDDLPHLFAAAGVALDDVIVDVGCGKGRVINWLLSHHPTNRIVGIELDPEICARTAHRLRRRPNVEIRCGDAVELLPPDGTVFYLFNPFDEDVLRRFADRLAGRASRPERVRLVYYNSRFATVLTDDERYEVSAVELPSRSQEAVIARLTPPQRGS
jgi:SAM-dependent methyltransferase